MCPPPKKVNTKGAKKKSMTKHQRSTKRDSSYWKYVVALHSVQNSNYSVKWLHIEDHESSPIPNNAAIARYPQLPSALTSIMFLMES